uniref:CARD domain-containing protein n=1 Tax=Sander lucioperca TaxID=283035 RepID=A0A8D0D254_SANLU
MAFDLSGPAVEIIIKHKLELVECLRADHSFILQHVHTKRIVTDRQYERLKHISQPEERVTELIDQVIAGGQESCSLFLKVLKEPDILQTYPQLKLITEKWPPLTTGSGDDNGATVKYPKSNKCLFSAWECENQGNISYMR